MSFGKGGGKSAYKSKNLGLYENQAQQGIEDLKKSKLRGPGGVAAANAGYDYSPINEAIEGYRKPSLYQAKEYKPFQFTGLPDQYAKTAYTEGAKNLQREGGDALTQIKQNVGTRRPGLIQKASEASSRDTTEKLAGLNNQVQLNKMNQDLETQRDQATENFKAAGFSDSQAQKMAENEQARLGALYSAGQGKIGTESGILGQEREDEQTPLKYLMQLFQTAVGGTNQGAQVKSNDFGSTLGFLGKLI